MADFEIRPARTEDSCEIVRLIRDGTDASLIDKLIYGCAGAPAYVQLHIEADALTGRRYFVAARDGCVLACADFTVSRDALSLKYVATAPHARRRGLGQALLGSAIANLRDRQAWVDLDVSVDNAVALSWYESLGFTPGVQSTYWEFGNDETLDSPAMEISDWPQAQACHAAFGFSEFHLETTARRVRVGRVGRWWFRVSTAEAVCAPDVRSALRAIDPGRRIYAVLPNGPLAPWIEANGKPVRAVQRMRTPLAALCRRLESPPGRAGDSQASSPERYAGK